MAHEPGAYGTGFPLADRQVVDMSNEIAYIGPDVAKFTTLLMQLRGVENVHNVQHHWPEDEYFLIRGASGVLNGSSLPERFTFLSWNNPELKIQFNQAEDFRAFESADLGTDTDVKVRIYYTKASTATSMDCYIRPSTSGTLAGDFPIDRKNQTIVFTSYGGTNITAETDVDADTTLGFIVQDPSTNYFETDKAFGGIQQMSAAVGETRKKTVIKDAFIQQFKVTASLAAEMLNTEMYGGPEWKRLHLRKGRQYKTNVDTSLWLSGRGSSQVLGGTDPAGYDAQTTRLTGVGVGVRATGGSDQRGWIRSKNYNAADGGYDTQWQIDVSSNYNDFYTDLTDILEKVSQTGSETRYAFCSRPWMSAFDKGIRAEGFARWEMKQNKYGFKVGQIDTTHCDLILVPVRSFQGFSMDGEDLSKYCVLLDMTTAKLFQMRGMATSIYPETQNNDVWGRQDEWRGTYGLKMVHEEANAILKLKTS